MNIDKASASASAIVKAKSVQYQGWNIEKYTRFRSVWLSCRSQTITEATETFFDGLGFKNLYNDPDTDYHVNKWIIDFEDNVFFRNFSSSLTVSVHRVYHTISDYIHPLDIQRYKERHKTAIVSSRFQL